MKRSNVDPITTLPDGSYLVVSTQSLKDGDFSCALYRATIGSDDDPAFLMLSVHVAARTCLAAQESAYQCARRMYPTAVETMKRPPYLIWRGPQNDLQS